MGHAEADRGAVLAQRLVLASADLARKRHLADADALGRAPTADEQAIHDDAAEALQAAIQALASWAPPSWEALGDKSEALAHARAAGGCASDAGLAELVSDVGRLAPIASEAAMPVWLRELERIRPVADVGENGEPAVELFYALFGLLYHTPVAMLAGAAGKLRTVLDPTIGIEHGAHPDDLPALRQVLAVLQAELPAPSALETMRLEAMRLEALADGRGYALEEDGGDWLGADESAARDALADCIHLAPCASRADAQAKLDIALSDLDHVGLDVMGNLLSTSLRQVRAWLAGEPACSVAGVRTRVSLEAPQAASPVADAEADARLDFALEHMPQAWREYRERHPELQAGAL